MSKIQFTFIERPDTQLATLIKGSLANQRGEDTQVVNQTQLASPAPTGFSAAPPQPQPPILSRAGSPTASRFPDQPQRRLGQDDLATVVIGPTIPGPQDQRSAERTMIRKSLPAGIVVHRYKIEGIIGEGGFGITYRARDLAIDREVAIKELFVRGTCFRSHTNEVVAAKAKAKPQDVYNARRRWDHAVQESARRVLSRLDGGEWLPQIAPEDRFHTKHDGPVSP